jgi:hypothetical protein
MGNVYSNQQIQNLWVQNGGNPAYAGTYAGIALAESSGNSLAVSKPNANGTVDVGLSQINSVHGDQATLDVNGNVQSAIAISNNGANFNPWTTYNTGAYQKYVDPSIQPNGQTVVPGSGTGPGSIPPSSAAVSQALTTPSPTTIPLSQATAAAPISGSANFVPNADPALQIDTGLDANPWYNDRSLVTGNSRIRSSVQPVSFTVYLDQYRLGQRLHSPKDNTPIQVQLNCSLREITIESKHIVNRVPSRTGMHITMWGMAPDLITGAGSTGVFMNQAGITDLFSTTKSPAGMANTGVAVNGANKGMFDPSEAYRVAAQDAFMEFMKLFQMNGVTWFHRDYQAYQSPRNSTQVDDNAWSQVAGASTAQQNARNNDVLNRGYISMNYKNNQFFGYFKSLSWTQDAEKPFSWDFNFVFQVERTFTALYYPSSATPPQPTSNPSSLSVVQRPVGVV